jgi:hypothetical protein
VSVVSGGLTGESVSTLQGLYTKSGGGGVRANVGTEGTDEKFPFWELFHRADQFPHISLTFGQIPSKSIPFFQNNLCAISDVKENTKMHFISPFGTGAPVSVQHLAGWALV